VSGVSVEGALELADAWDAAEARADDELRPVVSKGSLNIKKDTQARWAGHSHAPNLGYTVTYDLGDEEGAITSEIGPEKEKVVGGGKFKTPGHLAAIYEYGTPHSAPRPALNPALDAEEPRFEQAAGDAAEGLADV
jgi:hypothetical protein